MWLGENIFFAWEKRYIDHLSKDIEVSRDQDNSYEWR